MSVQSFEQPLVSRVTGCAKREPFAWVNSESRAFLARLDWIFGAGELEPLPRESVDAFVDARFDGALEQVGFEPMFRPDPAKLEATRWFEEEVRAGKQTDFFHKRPTTYTKKAKAITADDLFSA